MKIIQQFQVVKGLFQTPPRLFNVSEFRGNTAGHGPIRVNPLRADDFHFGAIHVHQPACGRASPAVILIEQSHRNFVAENLGWSVLPKPLVLMNAHCAMNAHIRRDPYIK